MSEQAFEPSLRPETPPTPEQSSEQPRPSGVEQLPSVNHGLKPVVSATPTTTGPTLPKDKDPKLIEIESILADGLDQAYLGLSPAKRQEFRAQGEILAHSIQQMLDKGKVNVKKVRDLIIKWLRIIPGVNRYFLEQEAKIKLDRLLELPPSEKL
jgi:hypothetical protein